MQIQMCNKSKPYRIMYRFWASKIKHTKWNKSTIHKWVSKKFCATVESKIELILKYLTRKQIKNGWIKFSLCIKKNYILVKKQTK